MAKFGSFFPDIALPPVHKQPASSNDKNEKKPTISIFETLNVDICS